jgi:hypothetical protein
MQRSENDIGCLQGSIDRVGVGLSGGVQRISEGLQGEISRVGGGIEGYISLVCTVSRDAYLRVSTDVLWLTPEMLGEEFDIYSNLNWKID